jgi:hypothetical protein
MKSVQKWTRILWIREDVFIRPRFLKLKLHSDAAIALPLPCAPLCGKIRL